MRKPLLVLFLVFGLGAGAAAQTVGTPVYMAPYRAFKTSELGASFSDPGNGWAFEGAYRVGAEKFDIGFRAGLWDWNGSDAASDDTRFLAGTDIRFRVLDHTEQFPLDGALTAGIGGYFGDQSRVYIPIGLSLGRRIELEGGTSFVPYLQPVLVPTFGDGNDDLLVAIGLGVDFKVSKQFDLRVSAGIGDVEGIAIGFAWIK
ncbi:MAG: hypothetical protein H6R40_761 [Gemmatimonadetes bacterium]|nr:hypothetical protein [Gemmatimonadota bacterium]